MRMFFGQDEDEITRSLPKLAPLDLRSRVRRDTLPRQSYLRLNPSVYPG